MPCASQLHTPAVITFRFADIRCDFVTLNKTGAASSSPTANPLPPSDEGGGLRSKTEGEKSRRRLFNRRGGSLRPPALLNVSLPHTTMSQRDNSCVYAIHDVVDSRISNAIHHIKKTTPYGVVFSEAFASFIILYLHNNFIFRTGNARPYSKSLASLLEPPHKAGFAGTPAGGVTK